jgi:hypothetical protein
MPYSRAYQRLVVATLAKSFAPGDDMRPRHKAEFFGSLDAGKEHEVLDRIRVGALGVWIADVLEPFGLGRHVGEFLKLAGG